MSPQFVDFNGDGQTDIVAGTFDGSPHVAFGSAEGFAPPEQILDASGARIVLNDFWDYDTENWEATRRCDVAGGATGGSGQGTSAIAFDWDGDGDHDLLIGDYHTGRVYRRTNEGTRSQPRFTTTNVPLLAGEQPLVVPGNVATLRALDWDADGQLDLLVGSVGDKFGNGLGGGVYLYRNGGRSGAPTFGAPLVLVAPDHGGTASPSRPDEGLYPDAADVDGDGDLDLVVGGQSKWVAPERPLSPDERTQVQGMQAELATAQAAIEAISDRIEAQLTGLDGDAADKKRAELWGDCKDEYGPLTKRSAELRRALDPLTFGPKTGYFVWYYRNMSH